MAKVVLDVSELMAFREKLLNEHHREKILRTLAKKLMELVREVASERTPVKTGRLKKSWREQNTGALTVEKVGNVYTVRIENKAFNPSGKGEYYASFVEEGYHSRSGRWIPGHWMMATAELEAERKAQAMFDEIIRDWWRWVNG